MKQTEHYQLNQWEYPDRILMDDFNADNRKIEAALEDVAGLPHGELLQTVSVPESIDDSDNWTVSLDVSNVDWNHYLAVLLVFRQAAETDRVLELYTFGSPSPSYSGTTISGAGSAASYTSQATRFKSAQVTSIFIPVLFNGNRPYSMLLFGSALAAVASSTPLAQTRTFQLRTSNFKSIAAGSTFELWGIR